MTFSDGVIAVGTDVHALIDEANQAMTQLDQIKGDLDHMSAQLQPLFDSPGGEAIRAKFNHLNDDFSQFVEGHKLEIRTAGEQAQHIQDTDSQVANSF